MANFNPNFTKVTRAQSKASIVIQGLSGRGKSGLALMIGHALADGNWSNVFGLDTENRSLNLFEGISSHLGFAFGEFMKFDLLRVHGFKPSHYISAKEAAKSLGASVFIQDSISHAWNGPSGVLQLVAQKDRENAKVNKFNAWGDPEVVFEKDSIFEMIRDSDIHMISTVRLKEKFEMVTGEGVKSLGEQQIQMPDLKYEPDLVLDMIHAGTTTGRAPRARVIKSRYAIFAEGEVYDFTSEVFQQLKEYLAEGADPAVIMEQQRQEFVREIKYILDSSKSKQAVWAVLKAELGHADTLLDDMPLDIVRKLLSRLIGG
jgi:hypothetical protein